MTDRFLTDDDLDKTLRRDVHTGLTGLPKTLPPKYFYDARGSELFEDITRLAEYYPTRRERAILHAHASDIARATAATTLLELGAGSGEKTRLLLSALQNAGTLSTYMPVDVSGEFLACAAADIARDHPHLSVRPVVADYERHLHLLPVEGRRLIVFLGSTIGNMAPRDRSDFLAKLAASMSPGDHLLVGADLVKDPGRLVRAYDDAQGVTDAFNHNVLHVINDRLGADFVPGNFDHVALWDPAHEWVEMRLRSRLPQTVHITDLDLTVSFDAGEDLRTEISAKFRTAGLRDELRAAGLDVAAAWTDADEDFLVCLARPA